MPDETHAESLQRLADERNADRHNIGNLYRGIQALSNNVPNFNNPDIDQLANTILESLKLMEQWIATECQKQFNK